MKYYIIVAFLFLIAIIVFFGIIKKKNKIIVTGLCVIAVIASIISNAIVNVIPMPKDTVQLTATGEKNPEALGNEISLKAVIVDDVQYEIQNAIEGKWFWKGNDYRWRSENSPNKPDGITPSITLEVPKGNDRKFVFNNNQYRGIVEISCNGESQTHDLYSKESVDVNIGFPGNSLATAYMIKLGRLALFALFIALILAYFAFAALKYDYDVIKAWFGRNWDKIYYAAIAVLYVMLLQKNSVEGSFWGDEVWQLGWTYSGKEDSSFYIVFDFLWGIWFKIMPYGQEYLRLFPQLFVAFTIYITGVIGNQYKNKQFGILFSSSVAFSLTIASQCAMEIRSYAMLLFASSIVLYMYMKKQRNLGREKIVELLVYGLFLTLFMDTHPFGLVTAGLIMISDFILIIMKKASKKTWVEFIAPAIYGVCWLIGNYSSVANIQARGYQATPSRLFDAVQWLFNYSNILLSMFVLGIIIIIYQAINAGFAHKFDFVKNYTLITLALVPVTLMFITYFYSSVINPENSLLFDRYFISVIIYIFFVMCYGIYEIIQNVGNLFKSFKSDQCFVALCICMMCIFNWSQISPWDKYTGSGRTVNQDFKSVAEYVMAQSDIYNKSTVFILDHNEYSNIGIQYYLTKKGQRDDINHLPIRDFSSNDNYFTSEFSAKYSTIYISYIKFGERRNPYLNEIIDNEYVLVSDDKTSKVKKYVRKN